MDKQSLSRQMRPITYYTVRRSNMTPEVVRWATQLTISGNMIKRKTCKFCFDNWKKQISFKDKSKQFGNQEMIWATHFSTIAASGRSMNLTLWQVLSKHTHLNHYLFCWTESTLLSHLKLPPLWHHSLIFSQQAVTGTSVGWGKSYRERPNYHSLKCAWKLHFWNTTRSLGGNWIGRK